MTSVGARLALLSLLSLSGSTGCTLVSGWNDLQGGTPADSGTDSASGQGADAATANDSSAADGGTVMPGVPCGATRCASGEGCCVALLGESSSCLASSQSCGPTSTYETCTDSSQCTASLDHAAQCCALTSGIPTISCRTTCASGEEVVCDPTLASPGCAAGMTCQPSSEGFGYNTCQ